MTRSRLQCLLSAALATACVIQTWRRGGDAAAFRIGAVSLLLLAMIWFSPLFASGLRRCGSAPPGSVAFSDG